MAATTLTEALEAAFTAAKDKKAVIGVLFIGAREPQNIRGDHILDVARIDGGVLLRIQTTDGEESHIIATHAVAHIVQSHR